MIESFCEPINCFLLKKSLAEQTGPAEAVRVGPAKIGWSAEGASTVRGSGGMPPGKF